LTFNAACYRPVREGLPVIGKAIAITQEAFVTNSRAFANYSGWVQGRTSLSAGEPHPHTAQDVAEAAEVCRELGLADLIGRMPAVLNQFVGDTGWRLSQGERSRIFLARALLQKAEIVVLDESLAALDPENFRQCLECVCGARRR
jgi:ABC-type molybdenum transport system ATPase subunit/photorepair protein PhrA